jgi:hypothetical protein
MRLDDMKHQIKICQLDPLDLVFENIIAASYGKDENKRLIVQANAQTKEIIFIISNGGHEYKRCGDLTEALKIYNQV